MGAIVNAYCRPPKGWGSSNTPPIRGNDHNGARYKIASDHVTAYRHSFLEPGSKFGVELYDFRPRMGCSGATILIVGPPKMNTGPVCGLAPGQRLSRRSKQDESGMCTNRPATSKFM